MSAPRPPLLPRVGFFVLTVLFTLALAAFALLIIAVPGERWHFVPPALAMLAGLGWTRTTRRAWLGHHGTAPAVADPGRGGDDAEGHGPPRGTTSPVS